MELPPPAPPAPTRRPDSPERPPAWLLWPGALLLLALLLFAAFSLGVYVGERGLSRPTLPPWPEPLPRLSPTPVGDAGARMADCVAWIAAESGVWPA